MRNIPTIAALAAGLATAATAGTPTTRHHHAAKADAGSAATRELNEKSLQQASTGTSMSAPMAGQSGSAMSDSGAAAPMNGGMSGAGNSSTMTPTPTDSTPTAPTTPQ